MRIILLTSKLNFVTAGGSVMELHLKAKGLHELGHDVAVVTAFSRANIIPEPLPYRYKEEAVMSRGLLGIQYHAWRIFRKYAADADVFYLDGQIFIYGAGLYRLFGGTVPVTSFFNTRLNCWADTSGNTASLSVLKRIKKKIRYHLEHWLGVPIANASDAFVFNTPMVEKLYLDWGFDGRKSTVIEDFADMRGIATAHRITRERIVLHQKNQKVLTLFATGRMIKEKGFDIVLRAFARLKDKESYRLVMSGDGPDKERLEALAKELGIAPFVTFPGWVNKGQLSHLFEGAHIFIFPKWWIEYGSTILTEALAYGLPCIIPGGGALEWLTEGKQPIFMNDSVEELAQRIEELGDNENLRIQAGKNARARTETLDYRILAKRLSDVMAAILRPEPSAPQRH